MYSPSNILKYTVRILKQITKCRQKMYIEQHNFYRMLRETEGRNWNFCSICGITTLTACL